MGAHGAVASTELGEDTTQAVYKDWRTAPVSPKVRAMLGFLEKMTLTPDALTTADGDALRAAGLSDVMIDDAIHVCATFNIVTRIADTFAFQVPSVDDFRKLAQMLLKRGYL
jgi:uncharacterized peroxidase-related enzyme